MKRRILLLASLVSILLSCSALASASAQFTLGQSTAGNIMFANLGGTTFLEFNGSCSPYATMHCVKGNGTLEIGNPPPQAKYSVYLTGGPPIVTPDVNPSVADVNMNGGTITLVTCLLPSLGGCNAGGELTGNIVFTFVNNANGMGGNVPQLIGTFTTTFSSGAFAANWPVGGPNSTTAIDVNLAVKGKKTVDMVMATMGSKTAGPVSSGEVISPVPEPGTMALLGSGILGLAGLLRRKLK